MSPFLSMAPGKKSAGEKKKPEEETSDGRGRDRKRTAWRPKHHGGPGSRSEEK